MKATSIFHLHLSRTGVVRDRNASGTGPSGSPLGQIDKLSSSGNMKWRATLSDGTVMSPRRTRHEALRGLFYVLKERQEFNARERG